MKVTLELPNGAKVEGTAWRKDGEIVELNGKKYVRCVSSMEIGPKKQDIVNLKDFKPAK